MPCATLLHFVPPSVVRHTPPHEMPTVTVDGARGSTAMLWMPGVS
jgi:hypothetical protein